MLVIATIVDIKQSCTRRQFIIDCRNRRNAASARESKKWYCFFKCCWPKCLEEKYKRWEKYWLLKWGEFIESELEEDDNINLKDVNAIKFESSDDEETA